VRERAAAPPLVAGRRTTGPLLVLGAAVSVQVGAAFAKALFDEVGPPAVVLMRLAFGAVAVWAIFRPRFRGRGRRELGLVLALGVVLACMNNAFYEALDRIPLGIAVTVEFLGPLAVAAVFWGVYILLGVRVGRVWPGASGLAVAMVVGAVLSVPSGLASGRGDLLDLGVLGSGLVVALACSAVPWSMEIEAMRRLPTHVFGVMMSVEPAVAALSGLVVLGERLSARLAASVALVCAASFGAALGARDPEVPVDA
jgi:inner membrane transporter RhtA